MEKEYKGVSYSVTGQAATGLNEQGINVEAEIHAAIDRLKAYEEGAVMYTKSPCPFCDRAKMLFKHKGVLVTEINAIQNMEEMTRRVTEATGNAPKTVPQIWLGGQYIGGFQELVEHYKQNP